MAARDWANKYSIAIVAALTVGGAYAYRFWDRLDDGQFLLIAAGVAAGAAGLVLLLSFLIALGNGQANLGQFQSAKEAILCGGVFAVVLASIGIAKFFRELDNKPAGQTIPNWIYGTWRGDGDCSHGFTVRRSENEREFVIEIGDESYPRRVVGYPSPHAIETDQGTYTHDLDGSMTSTERPLENKRFMPCGR